MTAPDFHAAQRRASLVVIGLAGPSGSGKSYSALRLARGLAGDQPFYVIDTENGKSEQLYGDQFGPWHCGVLEPPYSPERYVEAIHAAAAHKPSVIVIDSISDEHDGEGGLLWIQDEYLQDKAGDDARRRESLSFAAWKVAKGRHKLLVRELRVPKTHLIVCMRAQDKIELVKENGKLKAIPKRSLIGVDGWEPICERRLPYELFASFLMLPDRPGVPRPIKLPAPYRPFVSLDQPVSEQTGIALAHWAAGAAAAKSNGGQSDQAKKLTTELLDLGEQIGIRDDVAARIATNRHEHATTPAAHVAWLKKQIVALKRGVAARAEQPDDDIPVPAGVGAEGG